MKILMLLFSILLALPAAAQEGISKPSNADPGFVALVDMDMPILTGTGAYYERVLEEAAAGGAKLVIVSLNTPGGLLDTTQKMIQHTFSSKVPVVIYVSPQGSTATSAGVFLTAAGHIAAMAPGTSIGAAHPVAGDGKDIEGDMRAKAENMAAALVRSVSEQRGRNTEWVEKAVKESITATDQEALNLKVVDLVAKDIDQLLKGVAGRTVKVDGQDLTLADYSELPRRELRMSTTEEVLNVLANPNVAALLWLGATTGISIELYNPGAILPGVVGIICLILALAVSQVIPVNSGAILLLIVGSLLIGAEMYIASGILGIGGVIAITLGALYLVDTSMMPGMGVSLGMILPIAAVLGGFMLLAVSVAVRAAGRKKVTGIEGVIGATGVVLTTVTGTGGKVELLGEVWNARTSAGELKRDSRVRVLNINGLELEVEPEA